MILSRIIGTVKNEDGTIKTKGKISQFSVFIGSSPAKGAYCIPKSTKTPFEVYNNFLLENAPVNTFKQLEYQAGDTMNSTGVYDSYLLSTTITSEGVSSFDSTSKVKWLDPEDKTLYRTKTGAPAPGEWPNPIFIETFRGNVIQISEDSSFTKYYEYAVKTHVTDIYNLIPGRHYFYRILEGSNIIKTGEFDTKGQIRMIRLNALRNVRDCGGWPTVDGENRFKYGTIFRGGALGFFIDDSINTAANRALDLSILENDFGVIGEVDLNGDLTIDPFYVGHNSTENILSFSAACYYGMPNAYNQFYNVLNFIVQRVANGGAVYVHCQQGRDRTGSFISVIQALCGVCDDGILKDYEITTFWGNGTYRYYLEHDDTQNASRSMWKEFASSGTTQERVQTWFKSHYVANSIGNKATAEEAIDYVKSLLLEPLEQQEEQPVTPSEPEEEIEEYSIETSTIQNYLNNRYYKSSQLSNTKTQGDSYIIQTPVISTSEAGTTKGLTTTYLKGLQNMAKSEYSSYKSPQFVSADCQPSAKPRPYTITNQNVNSVEITDLTTNETFILSNKTDQVTATAFVGAYENGAHVTKSAKFDSLPVIGTPARSHVLDKVKPIFQLALSGGPTKAAIFKYVKDKDYSSTTYSGVTGSLGKIEYNSSNMDWAAWDNISVGTVAAPKQYTIVFYKNDGTFYSKMDDMYFGPLHVNYPTKIYNLIPGRIYHCVVKDADGNILEDKRLKPTGRLRMIHFEGVRNVRDLGGWPCYDESGNQIGTIAYDKLYRGSRPEPTTTYYGRIGISFNDRRMAYNFMHIGTQLDLREGDKDSDGGAYYLSNTSTSYLSLNSTTSTVPRERVSMASYWAAFDYIRWKDGSNYINPINNLLTCIGKIIKNLNQNKSTYFNCAQGADRTAAVAMVIEALCGVKDDSLLKDWEITSFSGNLKLHSDDTPYIGSIGDYRALNEMCDDVGSPNSGHHDLVRLIEMKENLDTYYGPGTLAENIVSWFKTICNKKRVSANTSKTVNYFNVLENREYYNVNKSSPSETAIKMSAQEASTVSESYLNTINSNSNSDFTSSQQVIDYLKWKLINWRSSVKTIAVLGDSQSAYKDDNRCPLQDLWWYKFAQSIGLNPETDVNNSSIGNTMVSRNYNNTENMGCSWSRINNLKVNGKDPDLIFVMMGGNDWVNSSISLGTYVNGDTLPGDSSTPEDLDFKPAFALMLSRIKKTYQNSLVVCINEPRVTNATVTGHDWDEWMYAQIEVAKEFDCPVIDLCHVCGNVIKDTLQSDNTSIYKSDQYVHLNALGHELIANVIK